MSEDNTLEKSGMTEISNNNISGVDTKGGDFKFGVFHAPSPNKIALLIEASKKLELDSPDYKELIEELESYHKPRAGRAIVG